MLVRNWLQYLAQAGTAAKPGFAFLNDRTLGLFRKAANQLGFTVNGTEVGYLDSSSLQGGWVATTANYRAASGDKVLKTDIVWGAMTEVTLTDAANVSWDMSTGVDFVLTLGGNRTLDNATNTTVGKRGRLLIIQDGTGSRTLALGSNYYTAGAVAPVLSTTAGAKDVLYYDVRSSTEIYLSKSITGAAT